GREPASVGDRSEVRQLTRVPGFGEHRVEQQPTVEVRERAEGRVVRPDHLIGEGLQVEDKWAEQRGRIRGEQPLANLDRVPAGGNEEQRRAELGRSSAERIDQPGQAVGTRRPDDEGNGSGHGHRLAAPRSGAGGAWLSARSPAGGDCTRRDGSGGFPRRPRYATGGRGGPASGPPRTVCPSAPSPADSCQDDPMSSNLRTPLYSWHVEHK